MQLLTLLLLASSSMASPFTRHATIKPWVAPLNTDSRGPCPMLNTLANHGYLPHNGRNLTTVQIQNAILDATNWSTDFGLPAAAALTNLNQTTLDLYDLDKPIAGEHPASLTRDDASSGNSNSIDPKRVAALLADASNPKNSVEVGGGGPGYITVQSLAVSRLRVQAESENDTPPVTLTSSQVSTSEAEAAILLLLMRDTESSLAEEEMNVSALLRAPVDRMREWLLWERFPTDLGWAPATVEVQQADVANVTAAIVADMASDS
ncbi:putative chloroperoxidase [Xylariaceae sp. FL0255]|nr:putative chloroperoxidase [Xylariaceae sp. FL0255]